MEVRSVLLRSTKYMVKILNEQVSAGQMDMTVVQCIHLLMIVCSWNECTEDECKESWLLVERILLPPLHV